MRGPLHNYTPIRQEKLHRIPSLTDWWIDCKGKKIQYHTLTYLGAGWGIGDMSRYSTERLIEYTRRVTDGGGVVTWEVPLEKNGLIAPAFVEPLKTLCEALEKSEKTAALIK